MKKSLIFCLVLILFSSFVVVSATTIVKLGCDECPYGVERLNYVPEAVPGDFCVLNGQEGQAHLGTYWGDWSFVNKLVGNWNIGWEGTLGARCAYYQGWQSTWKIDTWWKMRICAPECTGKDCGDDGCGGSCGTCDASVCSNGNCVATCTTHASSICYDNDVYWYNSCSVREEKKTECGALGCSGTGTCSFTEIVSPTPASSCPDDQIILKLSSDTNAHGALWNDVNYNTPICYSDIFGFDYTGANPHDCTGGNKVLGLSSSTNAHAEIPSLDSYKISIPVTRYVYNYHGYTVNVLLPPRCSCDTTDINVECGNSFHASEDEGAICYDQINGGQSRLYSRGIETFFAYQEGVCYGDLTCEAKSECSSDEKCVVTLSSANTNVHLATCDSLNAYPVKICCKASVEVASAVYWADMNGDKITEANFGDTVKMVMPGAPTVSNFEIFEEDDGLIGFLLGGDDEIRTVTGEIINGNLVAEWIITSGDLKKTNDHENFRFTVNGETSEELKISLNSNDDPMNIIIPSPKCGEYFDEDVNILINIDASDKDDVISGTVSIDGNSIGSFSNGEASISEVLDSPGNVQIVAEGVNTKGKKARAIVNIMVLDKDGGSYVDGKYVAACITEPKDFSYIEESKVKFDASATRGVRVTNGVLDLLVPGKDAFSWYWKFFMPGQPVVVSNFPDSVDPLAYNFTVNFPVAGDNSATLRVEI